MKSFLNNILLHSFTQLLNTNYFPVTKLGGKNAFGVHDQIVPNFTKYIS